MMHPARQILAMVAIGKFQREFLRCSLHHGKALGIGANFAGKERQFQLAQESRRSAWRGTGFERVA